MLTALLAVVLCLLGGIVFLRYNEKKVLSKIGADRESAKK